MKPWLAESLAEWTGENIKMRSIITSRGSESYNLGNGLDI